MDQFIKNVNLLRVKEDQFDFRSPQTLSIKELESMVEGKGVVCPAYTGSNSAGGTIRPQTLSLPTVENIRQAKEELIRRKMRIHNQSSEEKLL